MAEPHFRFLSGQNYLHWYEDSVAKYAAPGESKIVPSGVTIWPHYGITNVSQDSGIAAYRVHNKTDDNTPCRKEIGTLNYLEKATGWCGDFKMPDHPVEFILKACSNHGEGDHCYHPYGEVTEAITLTPECELTTDKSKYTIGETIKITYKHALPGSTLGILPYPSGTGGKTWTNISGSGTKTYTIESDDPTGTWEVAMTGCPKTVYIEVTEAPKCKQKFKVLDPDEALEGATVTWLDRTATTDSKGECEIESPEGSTGDAKATKSGYTCYACEKKDLKACTSTTILKLEKAKACTVETDKGEYKIGDTVTISYVDAPQNSTLSFFPHPSGSGGKSWSGISGLGSRTYVLEEDDTTGTWEASLSDTYCSSAVYPKVSNKCTQMFKVTDPDEPLKDATVSWLGNEATTDEDGNAWIEATIGDEGDALATAAGYECYDDDCKWENLKACTKGTYIPLKLKPIECNKGIIVNITDVPDEGLVVEAVSKPSLRTCNDLKDETWYGKKANVTKETPNAIFPNLSGSTWCFKVVTNDNHLQSYSPEVSIPTGLCKEIALRGYEGKKWRIQLTGPSEIKPDTSFTIKANLFEVPDTPGADYYVEFFEDTKSLGSFLADENGVAKCLRYGKQTGKYTFLAKHRDADTFVEPRNGFEVNVTEEAANGDSLWQQLLDFIKETFGVGDEEAKYIAYGGIAISAILILSLLR